MNSTAFTCHLQRFNACSRAQIWAQGKSLQQAWKQCQRGDWLLWLAARAGVDYRQVVLAACDCAEQAAPHWTPDTQLACAWALDAARRWVVGKTDLEEVRAAACTATAAAIAAADVAYTAAITAAITAAAIAAAIAADVAAAIAAAIAAANVAYTAAYTAADAVAYTAADAAYHKSLALSADLVRARISWATVGKALTR